MSAFDDFRRRLELDDARGRDAAGPCGGKPLDPDQLLWSRKLIGSGRLIARPMNGKLCLHDAWQPGSVTMCSSAPPGELRAVSSCFFFSSTARCATTES